MSEFSLTVVRLRIIVLQLDPDCWCATCGALSAIAICYVLEEPDSVPSGLHRLTYCDTCESRNAR